MALNENLATTTTAISIVIVFAVIFLTVIGILLYRKITGPISRMEKMMSEIAASQDFIRRVPIERMDEVGQAILPDSVLNHLSLDVFSQARY